MRPASGTHPNFRHVLLVHDDDDQLVEGVDAFVTEGLTSDGDAMVLGTRDRLGLMREVFGVHPRLDYGSVEELYKDPMRTLFTFQRTLAERQEPRVLWATGMVPLGHDAATQAAWDRYESAANQALATFPFRGLCAYDTRARPASVIATARATHPTVNIDRSCHPSPDYVDPATFHGQRQAAVPAPPSAEPSGAATILHLDQVRQARELLWTVARSDCALPSWKIEMFILAVPSPSGRTWQDSPAWSRTPAPGTSIRWPAYDSPTNRAHSDSGWRANRSTTYTSAPPPPAAARYS